MFAATPCSVQPCLNGGTCLNSQNNVDYFCTCLDGFSGSNCGIVAQGMYTHMSLFERVINMVSVGGPLYGVKEFASYQSITTLSCYRLVLLLIVIKV